MNDLSTTGESPAGADGTDGAAADGGVDTRARLVETARRLFHERGYAGTGIAEILRQAGVGSGSLYYFFPSKEDLLLAVLEHYRELLWPRVVGPVFDRIDDPIERVFGILDGYRRLLLATDCRQGCPIGNLALEMSDGHDAVRRGVEENFAGWRHAVAACFAASRDRLPPDTDPDELACFVLTVMEGAVMQARAASDLAPFETSVARLRDYVGRLLAAGTDWRVAKRGEPE